MGSLPASPPGYMKKEMTKVRGGRWGLRVYYVGEAEAPAHWDHSDSPASLGYEGMSGGLSHERQKRFESAVAQEKGVWVQTLHLKSQLLNL